MDDVPLATAEICMQGDDDINLHDKSEEGGKEKCKGCVGVEKTQKPHAVMERLADNGVSTRCGARPKVRSGGGENMVIVEDGVEGTAEDVDPNGEGIDVVHAQMVGYHVREDMAAEDKGNERDTNARGGSEKPYQEDEESDTKSEGWRNVDLGEHCVLAPVQPTLVV